MPDGYWSGLSSNLVFWSGWVFTVGGAAVGLYLGKEYAWIGWLCLAAGLVALVSHNREIHRLSEKRERGYESDRDALRAQLQEEVQRREGAERRLAEVPAEALARLATLVTEGAVNELIGLLARQADVVGRLKLFTAAQAKPLSVRSFHRQQGEFYVVVKGSEQALPHLRPGDTFVLLRKNDAGVEFVVARLVVHQPIAAGADVVYFQVVAAITDTITHLTGLAGDQPIEGLKGYTAAPGFDLAGVPALDFAQVDQAIPHLAANLSRHRGG